MIADWAWLQRSYKYAVELLPGSRVQGGVKIRIDRGQTRKPQSNKGTLHMSSL